MNPPILSPDPAWPGRRFALLRAGLPGPLPIVLLTLLLVLSGCTTPLFDPGTPETPVVIEALSAANEAERRGGEADLTHRLVVQSTDGNLYIMGPDGEEVVSLANGGDAPDGYVRRFQQPTWSPDGSRIAWTEIDQQNRPGGVFVSRLRTSQVDGGASTTLTVPFPPFYIGWAPDGRQLVYLSNWSTQGLALRLVDVAGGGDSAQTLGTGAPFYSAWSPDSMELLTHVGGDAVGLLDLEGSDTPLTDEGGIFSTPLWSADGSRVYYAVRTGEPQFDGQTVGLDQFVAFRPQPDGRPAQQSAPRQILVAMELATGERRDLFPFAGSISFGLSPDDQRMAFVVTEPGASMANSGVLHVLDVETGQVLMAEGGDVVAFFWNPAGDRLLFAKLERSARSLYLRWHVWDGQATTTLGRFLPSQTFARDYLPYFDQFALSQRFWSPDGQFFVYAGYVEDQPNRMPGIFVQSITPDSQPIRIANGEFAAWSPR